jgi:hypothetical protein
MIIDVEDLPAEIERLRAANIRFRNEIATGPGGSEVLLDDPSGNPIELFQPAGQSAKAGNAVSNTENAFEAVRSFLYSVDSLEVASGQVKTPLSRRRHYPLVTSNYPLKKNRFFLSPFCGSGSNSVPQNFFAPRVQKMFFKTSKVYHPGG